MRHARLAPCLILSIGLSAAVAGRHAFRHTEAFSPSAAPVQNPATSDRAAAVTERAYRANNLGVALLEQFDYDAAATSFRQALDIDPALNVARLNLAIALFYAGSTDAAIKEAQAAAERLPATPHVYYILGLLARAQNRVEDAVPAFRRVLQIDPSDVGAKVNLGQVYLQQRKYSDALALFREGVASEPYNVTAAYNLAIALTRAGEGAQGQQAMQRFQKLRDSAYGTTFSQTYLEQGRYAEAIASTGAEAELVDSRTPAVTFADATATALPLMEHRPTDAARSDGAPSSNRQLTGADFTEQGRRALVSGLAGGVTLFDADGDGDLDLFEIGRLGWHLYRNDAGVFRDATERAGLSASGGNGIAIGAVAGDYDNDGKADLFILGWGGNHLLHQQTDGRFEDVTVAAGLPAYPYLSTSAALVDVDHDGDLDIVTAGLADLTSSPGPDARIFPVDLPPAPNQLLRNNGSGTFADITADARLGGGSTHAIAIVPTDYDNRRDIDMLVASDGERPMLFQNVRDGSFRDAAAQTRLPAAARYTAVAAGDVNKDGYTDFFFGKMDEPGVFALSDGHGAFLTAAGPEASRGAVAAQFVDYDNDGLLDLFVLSDRAAHLFRNVGGRWSDTTDQAGLVGLTGRATSTRYQAIAFGDLDGDGDTDAAVRLGSGDLRVWRNDGGNRNHSLRVRLAARVSNRSGVGSKIELRAGSLRQKLETSAATPAVAPADVLFGLGARAAADVVRVLWPAGILQAETDLAGAVAPDRPSGGSGARFRVVTITELDRKPSSCPYLYTWNGTRFEFVTDFMGGGEMGTWLAPSTWNQPDPDEYVRIRGDQLRSRNGRYELRVTNELEEAMFVDRLQLVAVDHPAGVEVFPNEGLRAPPPPPFTLTPTRGARPPEGASDDHGHDVLPQIASMDRRYPDDFGLNAIRGYADPHALMLDLGPGAEHAVLLMTGWTDYAFSGDNVAAHQGGLTLRPPLVQAKDDSGAWRTVVEDMGFPVGRPQTVVVDLRGKLDESMREVRILTNMRIYWDQILVDTSGGAFPTRVSRLDPAAAELGWRGFSAEVTPDGREPFAYDYDHVSFTAPWKVMVGRYTREGDVRALLRHADDMFVISRPGDEIALSFDDAAFPVLAAGWTRTFLLYVDGFSKEMNISSASPDALEPLPFHAMSGYPYGSDESYPRTEAHRNYLARYNTRAVNRPLPPIELQATGARRIAAGRQR